MGGRLRQAPSRSTTVLLYLQEPVQSLNGVGEVHNKCCLKVAADTPRRLAVNWLWCAPSPVALLNATQSATAFASHTRGLNGLYTIEKSAAVRINSVYELSNSRNPDLSGDRDSALRLNRW